MPVARKQEVSEVLAIFIEGVTTASQGDEMIEAVNPSNGRHCLTLPAGCSADVNRAVASARAAVEDGRWSGTGPSVRKATLLRFADLVAAHSSELDALDAAEMGKPVHEQLFSSAAAANLLRFSAEAGDKVMGDVVTSDAYSFVAQRRVPRGVVAGVVPWNFPTFNALLKVAPALSAGNSVVLKPSELASRSALQLAQLAVEAGLPPGVLNVVLGRGELVGRDLGLHFGVDMVAFTGSTEVGKLMLQYSGQSNMKTVLAECGGKSPQIVFDDGVDVDAVGDAIAGFLLANQGQTCSVGSRVLVQRSIESRLVDRIAARMREVVIGDALDPRTTFGPLASEVQRDRVMRYIGTAQSEDADLVHGGRRTLSETGGYFVEPTLFRHVRPSSRIAQEEIFGPVLSITAFDDEVEAIRIANGTIYGLAAYVWTSDLSRGMRMAKGIRSSVIVSAVPPRGEGASHAASFEPYGQSGVGVEGGLRGLETYLRRQLVWFNHS